MRRAGAAWLAGLATLALAAPAPAARPRLEVLRKPAVVGADGYAFVPVRCHGGCYGTIRPAATWRKRVRLPAGGREALFVRVRDRRVLRLRVQLRDTRPQRIRVPLTRRPVPRTCGLGSIATIAREVPGATLLFVTADDGYWELDGARELFACRAGRPIYLDAEYTEGFVDARVATTFLSETWAAWVVTTGTDQYGNNRDWACGLRLADAKVFETFPSTYDTAPPAYTVGVSDTGSLALGTDVAGMGSIAVSDDAGYRVVDEGPGVAAASLAVAGDAAAWLRDGSRRPSRCVATASSAPWSTAASCSQA